MDVYAVGPEMDRCKPFVDRVKLAIEEERRSRPDPVTGEHR